MKQLAKRAEFATSRFMFGALIAIGLVVLFCVWRARSQGSEVSPTGTGDRSHAPDLSEPAPRSLEAPSDENQSSLAARSSTPVAPSETKLGAGLSSVGALTQATSAIVVCGAVRDTAGRPIEADRLNVAWIDESGERLWASRADGSYSLAGIAPGAWHVSTAATGFRPLERDVTVAPNAGLLREDLVVVPAALVLVRVQVDGRSLQEVLKSDTALRDIEVTVVATRAAPPKRLPANGQNVDEGDGCAQYSKRTSLSDADRQTIPPEFDGRLQLRDEPPMFVSVTAHHVVLATQALESGVDSLAFDITLESLHGLLSGVVMRIVDAQSGEPCAQAVVNSSNANSSGFHQEADSDGFVRYEHWPPGLWQLGISAPDHARILRDFEFEPGRVTDLGEIRLERPMVFSGRVVDAAGAPPRRALISMRPERKGNETSPFDHIQHVVLESDAQGQFRSKSSAPGRWVLGLLSLQGDANSGEKPALGAQPIIVDTTRGPAENLVIRLEPATAVRMKPAARLKNGIRFEVLTVAHVPTFRLGYLEDAAETVDLIPGSYILRVSDRENRVLHETPFQVSKEPLTIEVGP